MMTVSSLGRAPSIHSVDSAGKQEVMAMFCCYETFAQADDERMWKYQGRPVKSKLFGVTQAKNNIILKRNGRYGHQQRLVIYLVLPAL